MKNTIATFITCAVTLLLYPQHPGVSQKIIPDQQSNEIKKEILEEKQKIALSEASELIKNIDKLETTPKVVYRTKIKTVYVTDTIYYPLPIDSMRFFDYVQDLPDTVFIKKVDTVIIEKKRGKWFNFKRKKSLS